MSIIERTTRNLHFIGQLWRNKSAVRSLLNSENYIYVRDFPPGHFYSPLPDLPEVRRTSASVFNRSATAIEGIDLREANQLSLTDAFGELYGELPFSAEKTANLRYYFDNPYFSFGDGVILYSILRFFKPKRVIEIGSGFSSAEMLDVSDRFLGGTVSFTFIEPFPDRLYGLLSERDRKVCTVEIKPVQEVDLGLFSSLEENDILFVDSSHVAKTNSDVLYILFRIMPVLKKGVIVHFHDIPWPFEYPQRWIEGGRAWNEAYFLRAFLQYNHAFEIVYFNSFVAEHHRNRLAERLPLSVATPSFDDTVGNTSLWLRKTCAP